ncbi:MAG: membrane protein insertase YidC [Brachymonas sp.]
MNDMRRSILWVVFVFSLIMLWDKWQIHNGKSATFFPDPQMQTAAQTATPNAEPPSPAPSAAAVGVPGASQNAHAAASGVPGNPAAPAVSAAPSASMAQSNLLRPADVSAAATAVTAAPATPSSSAAIPPASSPAAALNTPIVVETDDLTLNFSPIGGRLIRAELKHYAAIGEKANSPQRMVLFEESAGERIYRAETGLTNIPGLNHTTAMQASVSSSATETEVRFASPEVGGVKLVETYTVPKTGYAIAVRHEVVNQSAQAIAPELYFQLTRDGNKPPGDSMFYSTFTGPAFYSAEKKYQKVEFKNIEKANDTEAKFERKADAGYVAMVQHYFASAWLPDDANKGQKVSRENFVSNLGNNLYAAGLKTQLPAIAPGQHASFDSRLFVGPQQEVMLEKIYPGLEAVKDYGIFTIFAKPLFQLMALLHSLLANWGWTIVALVVVLKAALYWLNAKAYSSMAKMKAVTPRITEMRERLKDNPQQMQTEMMKIYREEKVNPIGGCLPMLIQIPIFIGLYWVILSSVELRGAPWLGWISDLSAKDPWYILPILMTATSLLQVWLNPTPPDPMQAKLMWFMPLAFSVMFFVFPSGLVLYWLSNNILSIAQQWVINKRLGVN